MENYRLVDLFPYKIQNRDGFYNRKHPVGLHPDTAEYHTYWRDQWEKVIEGMWVNDNGTWVYMMPKLYFYINITKIADTMEGNKSARALIHPRLRDTEWIIFTYIFCCQGFSGFQFDEEYTCHETIGKIQEGKEVDDFDIRKLPENVKKPDGTYKKFIDAWTYLTRHYLIDNKASKPLGVPYYDNPMRNGLIFSCRSTGKSLDCFVGDFMHEFLTGGVRYKSMAKSMLESPLLFFAGSSDEKKMNKTLRMVKTFYDNMPGSYSETGMDGKEIFTPSPFFRQLQGSWSLGNALTHQYKRRDGRTMGSKSMIELNAIHSHDVATGDRYALILVEELGLLKIMMQFYDSCKDSMEVNGVKTGRMMGLGTGGDVERIQESKMMFTNTSGYDVFGIPNFWENPNVDIGLFIPVEYKFEDYKDPQGNTDLELARGRMWGLAEAKRKKSSARSYKTYLLNNPFIPSQIFQSSKYSLFPAEEAINRLTEIETKELWAKKATVGKLVPDTDARYKYRFDPDLTGELIPINSYLGFDIEKDDTKGACVMYEPPPDIIPDGLYKAIYDPVSKDGKGTSLNSLIIYKGLSNDNYGLSNNIVFEWIGRLDTLEEAWEIVFRAAKYYNAKIFPETNTPGFVSWIRHTKRAGYMLQTTASYIEKEIFKNYRHDADKVGFNVRGNRGQMTFFLDNLIHDWLMEEADHDSETGEVTARVIDTIYSTRLLEEIAYYSDDNYDHISSLRGLMLWLANDRKRKTFEVRDDVEDDIIHDKKVQVRLRKPKLIC
jgi:hypothetical protein